MNTHAVEDFVRSAKLLYEHKLRATLENSHRNEFVAIEPISGEYFLGRTLSEALGAARNAHPDRLSHVMRVGHRAALHFGVHLS
jgi:hypothetical protein